MGYTTTTLLAIQLLLLTLQPMEEKSYSNLVICFKNKTICNKDWLIPIRHIPGISATTRNNYGLAYMVA